MGRAVDWNGKSTLAGYPGQSESLRDGPLRDLGVCAARETLGGGWYLCRDSAKNLDGSRVPSREEVGFL
jgi:hypothetical protein